MGLFPSQTDKENWGRRLSGKMVTGPLVGMRGTGTSAAPWLVAKQQGHLPRAGAGACCLQQELRRGNCPGAVFFLSGDFRSTRLQHRTEQAAGAVQEPCAQARSPANTQAAQQMLACPLIRPGCLHSFFFSIPEPCNHGKNNHKES